MGNNIYFSKVKVQLGYRRFRQSESGELFFLFQIQMGYLELQVFIITGVLVCIYIVLPNTFDLCTVLIQGDHLNGHFETFSNITIEIPFISITLTLLSCTFLTQARNYVCAVLTGTKQFGAGISADSQLIVCARDANQLYGAKFRAYFFKLGRILPQFKQCSLKKTFCKNIYAMTIMPLKQSSLSTVQICPFDLS